MSAPTRLVKAPRPQTEAFLLTVLQLLIAYSAKTNGHSWIVVWALLSAGYNTAIWTLTDYERS